MKLEGEEIGKKKKKRGGGELRMGRSMRIVFVFLLHLYFPTAYHRA